MAAAEIGTRRTIYYRYRSGENIPLLTMFDAANVSECYRRHETIVPQQALALEQRHGVGRRRPNRVEIRQRLRRRPRCASRIRLCGFREHSRPGTERRRMRAHARPGCPGSPRRLPRKEKPPLGRSAVARSALIHVLLNHNDFISIR